MDLLHQGVADCFCLVSSDSDYTRLATRIRELGSFVIGIGKKTTPQPFVAACDVFTCTENLSAYDHGKSGVMMKVNRTLSPDTSKSGIKCDIFTTTIGGGQLVSDGSDQPHEMTGNGSSNAAKHGLVLG